MSYNNISHDRYNDGSDITCHATTAITGKTLVTYAGALKDGLITVKTAPAGGHIAGVAKYDAANGTKFGVARGSSRILTITTATALNAGDKVQVGDKGKATIATDGEVIGFAVAPATAGTDALISLAY